MKQEKPFSWLIPQLSKQKPVAHIKNFIIDHIRSGELSPGSPLPSYRSLARLNNISPNSAKRAYSKLIADYWLVSAAGSGTYVAAQSPELDFAYRPGGFTDNFPAGLEPKSKLLQHPPFYTKQFFTGVGTDFPNPATFPEHLLLKHCSHHRVTRMHVTQADLLKTYDGAYLIDAVLKDLNKRRKFGLKAGMLEIIKGRQTCLNRVFKMLLVKQGEVVINTSPHDVILNIVLQKREVEIYPINMVDDVFMEKIEQVLMQTKVRLIYIRPQCSFPEGQSLSVENCLKLIELSKRYKICIVEEDDDHEFYYEKGPYKPLATYEHEGYVIYLGALSKVEAYLQSLRLIVASSQFIELLNAMPNQSIETRDVIKEMGIADMILSGDLASHIKTLRLQALESRYQLNFVLDAELHKYLSYAIPAYGLTFWLKFSDEIDLNLVLRDLEDMGIVVPYHPNNQKTKEKVNYMMLGFGAFDLDEAAGAALALKMIIER